MSEYDPLLTMSALNMAIVSLHRITSSGDRLILDREYDSIINNLKMAEINADKELMTLYGKILEVIQKGRLREDTREALKRDDSEKKQKSVKEIITGNVLKSFSFNPVKWLGKLAMSSASEYFTQKKESQELASNNDESQLRLRHEELSEYSELQRILMSASWSLLRQYHLPDNYRLTQNALDKFSSAMNEHDPLKRHRMMKYFERDFAMYAPYWFYRAKSANEAGNDDEAGKYFARFGEVWRPVLRKDPYRAEAMKYKIEALMRSGVSQNNVGEILKCLEEMRANTELDEWASNIFAGMVYFALGRKDEAEECVMCNIDFGFELEISGKILAQIETEELPPRIEPLPEKIEAAPVIVAELSKPESQPKVQETQPAPQPEPPKPEPQKPKTQPKLQETLPAPEPKRPPMSDNDFLNLCEIGNAAKIKEAILNGANVNAKLNGFWASFLGSPMSPLMLAAYNGHTEIAELLLQHGADVNDTRGGFSTALIQAAEKGRTEIVEILLKYGADIEAKAILGTALCYAAGEGHVKIVEILLKHGANIEAKNVYGETPLIRTVRGSANEEIKAKIAAILIEHGADVNAKSERGDTVLKWAKYSFNTKSTVKLLLRYGARE